MNAVSYGPPSEAWQEPEDEAGGQLPGRPRRRFLTRWSALLLALVTAGIGFYIGVRVEKGELSGSSTGGGAASLAARFAAARGGGGFAGGRFGAGGGAGGGVAGTVASVNGNTIYVTETGGNTVKVKLSSATKVTKSTSVNRSKVDPGDTVAITGVTGSKGTVSATTVSDSGASGSTSTSTSTSSSSRTSGSSSSVSSLFGGG